MRFADGTNQWTNVGGCQNRSINFVCNQTGYALKIEKALYGRFDTSTCFCEKCWVNSQDNGKCDNSQNCGAFDGTAILKSKCEGRTVCSFMAEEIWDGQEDPCPGRAKYAMIKGKCEMIKTDSGTIIQDRF